VYIHPRDTPGDTRTRGFVARNAHHAHCSNKRPGSPLVSVLSARNVRAWYIATYLHWIRLRSTWINCGGCWLAETSDLIWEIRLVHGKNAFTNRSIWKFRIRSVFMLISYKHHLFLFNIDRQQGWIDKRCKRKTKRTLGNLDPK